MEKYPKMVKLKNGQNVELRLLTANDIDLLINFFRSIPEEDRMFLRIDVMQKENILKRYGKINYENMFPLIAVLNDQIIGEGTIFRPEFGWMRNLGELRCLVSREFQRLGLCTILVRELFLHAISTDFFKIQAEIMEDQVSGIAAFKKMGFKEETVLKKHVTDINGNRRNLVIMSLDIEELWYILEDYVPDKSYVV